MTDCAPWVDDSVGRIRVTPSGYYATEHGEMTYDLSRDTVYRYIGVGYDQFLIQTFAMIVAQPSQALTDPGFYFTNLTIGNGSYDFQIHQSEGFVDLMGRVQFGSTTTVAGLLVFTFPYATFANMMIVSDWGYVSDFSGAPGPPAPYYPIRMNFDAVNQTVFRLTVVSVAGSATSSGVTTGAPVAFANGDTLTFGMRWQLAEPRTA